MDTKTCSSNGLLIQTIGCELVRPIYKVTYMLSAMHRFRVTCYLTCVEKFEYLHCYLQNGPCLCFLQMYNFYSSTDLLHYKHL